MSTAGAARRRSEALKRRSRAGRRARARGSRRPARRPSPARSSPSRKDRRPHSWSPIPSTCRRGKMCDGVLKTLRRRDDLYDPLVGAEDRRADAAQHVARLHRELPARRPSRCRTSRPLPGRPTPRGALAVIDNTWAMPALLQAVRRTVSTSPSRPAPSTSSGMPMRCWAPSPSPSALARRLVAGRGGLGICAGTEEMYLGLRGIRTLEVRLERHWRSGWRSRAGSKERPEVARVIHPALPSHPHELLETRFPGRQPACSRSCSSRAARRRWRRCWKATSCSAWAPRWGGYESLSLPFDAPVRARPRRGGPEGPTAAHPHRPGRRC